MRKERRRSDGLSVLRAKTAVEVQLRTMGEFDDNLSLMQNCKKAIVRRGCCVPLGLRSAIALRNNIDHRGYTPTAHEGWSAIESFSQTLQLLDIFRTEEWEESLPHDSVERRIIYAQEYEGCTRQQNKVDFDHHTLWEMEEKEEFLAKAEMLPGWQTDEFNNQWRLELWCQLDADLAFLQKSFPFQVTKKDPHPHFMNGQYQDTEFKGAKDSEYIVTHSEVSMSLCCLFDLWDSRGHLPPHLTINFLVDEEDPLVGASSAYLLCLYDPGSKWYLKPELELHWLQWPGQRTAEVTISDLSDFTPLTSCQLSELIIHRLLDVLGILSLDSYQCRPRNRLDVRRPGRRGW